MYRLVALLGLVGLGACASAALPWQPDGGGRPDMKCTSPLMSCTARGCVDTSSNLDHCGGCNQSCRVSPDGGPPPGSGNPDAGLPPSDGGVNLGWAFGTEACSSSKCSVTCPASTTLCSDSLCWDTAWAHAHCGTCAIACSPDQHCNLGKCCSIGQANCGGLCIDVLSDKTNCGGCGNVCGGTLRCVNGQCKGPPPVTFSGDFQGTPAALCTQWQTFLTQLGSGYSKVTLSGSADPTGVTCTSPSVVDALAAALKSVSSYGATCDGHLWTTCSRDNDELWIDPPSLCNTSNCPNPGRILRACFSTAGYNGLNTATCGSAPTQTIVLTFQ